MDIYLERRRMGANYQKALVLDRIDFAKTIFVIASVALFIFTVVLLALTQARFIHPITPIISFCAIFPLWIIVVALDCCKKQYSKNLSR